MPIITRADKELYQRQIEATDRQIDALATSCMSCMEEIEVAEGV
jgi:prefoldin subunit 5